MSKGSSGRYYDRPRTLNITPFLLKVGAVFLLVYIIYAEIFYVMWGIIPYTLGYTVYRPSIDYSVHGIEKGDFLVIKETEEYDEEGIVLKREGTEYKIGEGIRNPYGTVCFNISDKLENMFKTDK